MTKKQTPKVRTKLEAKGGETQALHLQGSKHEAVAIWSLSVLIIPDEQFWFAQGLEINYGAQGDSPEEAQENFQNGLLATIRQHLRVHGDITRILKFAPSAILQEAAVHKSSIKQFAQVSFHEIIAANDSRLQTAMPFDQIRYLLQAA